MARTAAPVLEAPPRLDLIQSILASCSEQQRRLDARPAADGVVDRPRRTVKHTFNLTRYELPELIDALGYKTGVEVGVNLGQFSYHLLKYSRLERLSSVDNYSGKYRKAMRCAQSYLSRFGGRSQLLVRESVDAAGAFPGQADFVYIDAAHDEASVTTDIQAWRKIVRPGGMLAGHDYTGAHAGVMAAVDKFAAESGLPLFLTAELWATWMFFMPEAE